MDQVILPDCMSINDELSFIVSIYTVDEYCTVSSCVCHMRFDVNECMFSFCLLVLPNLHCGAILNVHK